MYIRLYRLLRFKISECHTKIYCRHLSMVTENIFITVLTGLSKMPFEYHYSYRNFSCFGYSCKVRENCFLMLPLEKMLQNPTRQIFHIISDQKINIFLLHELEQAIKDNFKHKRNIRRSDSKSVFLLVSKFRAHYFHTCYVSYAFLHQK